ncbi:hypothetical protein HF263_22935 [Rhizobium leguminosarum]|uniref:hypothetical protein n=1 Tax=Rhizobium leguminosarum TaxID=384 RepID=UPI001C904884|nr:hypothetical protein [Rhizobium leguminosarum]MBY2994483.1 hypothetical protein [Rhizobium leguminosarum]MBY3058911.1 hypothetical protein [Rhizobium leguminosarum]
MPNRMISSDSSEKKRRAAAARARFDKVALKIASEHRFGGPDAEITEIEIMEEATRLVREALKG